MSKFDKIFEAREQTDERRSEKSDVKVPVTAKNRNTAKGSRKREKQIVADAPSSSAPVVSAPSTPAKAAEPVRRGRPNGKRSDPDYLGFTTYIRKSTHLKVKIALLQEGKGREMSELVEELLGHWLTEKR